MAAPPGAETAARGELVLPTARTDAADSEKPWTALKIEQHAAVTVSTLAIFECAAHSRGPSSTKAYTYAPLPRIR